MNHENAQKQRDFKRKRYKEKPEIKIDYQKKKRYQENSQMQKDIQRKR